MVDEPTRISFSAAVGDPARDSLTGGSSPLEDEERLDTGGESCCLQNSDKQKHNYECTVNFIRNECAVINGNSNPMELLIFRPQMNFQLGANSE